MLSARSKHHNKIKEWMEETQNKYSTKHVEHYVNAGMSKKDAIKTAAKDRGVPKNDIYMHFVDK